MSIRNSDAIATSAKAIGSALSGIVSLLKGFPAILKEGISHEDKATRISCLIIAMLFLVLVVVILVFSVHSLFFLIMITLTGNPIEISFESYLATIVLLFVVTSIQLQLTVTRMAKGSVADDLLGQMRCVSSIRYSENVGVRK